MYVPATTSQDTMAADSVNVTSTTPLAFTSSGSSNLKLDLAEHIVSDYIQPCVCIFGICCNLLNMLVLTRPQLKESPYSYLLGLTSMDLGVLLILFLRGVVSAKLGKGIYGWAVFDAFIFLPIGNMFSNGGVWITVFLTFERWVSVTFPLKAKEICTKSNARKVMLGVITISCIINIPRFFCRSVIAVPSMDTQMDKPSNSAVFSATNRIYYTTVSTKFEQSEIYKGITWMYICSIHVIPCATLIWLNICLLRAVYKANTVRLGLHGDTNNIAVHISREQRRLTITCVSIICLFLICVIPTAFANPPVAYSLFGGTKPPEVFFNQSRCRLLRIVTNMLLSCNLSLNFIIYCLFNHKFLKTLRHMCKTYAYRMCKVEITDRTFHRMSSSSSGTIPSNKFLFTRRPQSAGRVVCESIPCLTGHNNNNCLELKSSRGTDIVSTVGISQLGVRM